MKILLLVSLVSLTSSIPNHRKVRQIRPEDVRTVSEEQMREMTPEMLRRLNLEYTREFFKPIRKPNPMTVKLLLDKESFLREDPIFTGNFQDWPIETVNFDQRFRQQKGLYLPVYLHEMQEKSRQKSLENSNQDDFLKVNMEKMLVMLNNVFTVSRNYRSMDIRDATSEYISTKFGSLGLLTGIQYFYPSKFFYQFVGYNDKHRNPIETLPPGANVFAIYPGQLWGTAKDRIVVIGAHWDTMDGTDGYNDNGSGVATVLEIARQIVESRCKPKNTIIFVTFDLEEMGAQGSNEFVNRFLIPDILRKFGQSTIGGAFIADTMMNFNSTLKSQEIPDTWTHVDPVTSQKIQSEGNRGDFLAIIQRRQPDAHLVNLFSKHWNHLDVEEFKLRPFRIDIQKDTPNLDTLTDIVPFVRSDHSRFWIVNETDYSSLPAILVTDTGPLRGKMAECYHSACDSVRGPYDASFANMDFYKKTVQTILNAVLELSKSRCLRTDDLQQFYMEEENENKVATSGSSGSSYLQGTLMSLTEFIRRYMPWNQ